MEILFTDNSDKNTCLEKIQAALSHATKVNIAVAFLKQSGFNLLKDDLLKTSEKGSVELIVGLDFRTTEPKTLKEILGYSKDFNIRCYCFSDYRSNNNPVFHPKLYYIEGKGDTATAIIGSSNFTRGGMRDNYEINSIFRGNLTHDIFTKIFSLYNHIKIQESVFMPDLDYISAYKDVYKQVKRDTDKALKDPSTRRAIGAIKKIEKHLPRAFPTQKQLIIESISRLPKDANGFVHLKDIQKYVTEKALSLKIPFDYETLDNSIRGRLNEHSIGKGGEDLFERYGSPKGGTGFYKLSEEALKLLSKSQVF